MDGPAKPTVYEFGDFELDVMQRVVRSRTRGARLKLTPRVFDTLLYLVEHAGELVEKAALMQAIWPKVVVEEGNVTQTIHELRRALGERPDERQFIVTVPGRGYRFVADVTRRNAAATGDAATRALSARPPRAKAAALAALALVVVGAGLFIDRWHGGSRTEERISPRYSIAVLPFVDLSAEQDQRYLGDGIAEEILNRLAQTPALRVIARTSSFSFEDEDVDIAAIAARLGVTHVLEGSVRRADNRVRVTAQLVETRGSSHLWSKTFDRDLDDLFAVQDEIALAVAEALQLTLVDARPGVAAPPILQAYESFLQGQFFYYRRSPGDIERARDYYQQALAVDPGYARAWAALAGAYGLLTDEGKLSREVGLGQQRDAAEKAVALDPRLPEAHLRLGQYHFNAGNRDAGRRHFHKARELDPDHPLVLSFAAGSALRQGRLDQAIEMQRRAVELDPLAASQRGNLGHYLLAAGRLEEAKTELLQVQDLNPALADPELAFILILQQEYDEALARIGQWPEGAARDQGYALVYHALGRQAEADAALEGLLATADVMGALRVAEVYAFRGDVDEAFRWLATFVERSRNDSTASTWQILSGRIEMRQSPFLRRLHDDPRWNALLADADLD